MLLDNLKVIREIFFNVKSVFIFIIFIAVATSYIYFDEKGKHKYIAAFYTENYYELNYCFPLYQRFATLRIIGQKIKFEKNLKKFTEIKKLEPVFVDPIDTDTLTIIFKQKRKIKDKINFDDLEKQLKNFYIELTYEYFEIQLKFKELAIKKAIDTLNELKNFETISVNDILNLNESYSIYKYCDDFFKKSVLDDTLEIKIQKRPMFDIIFLAKVYLGTLILYLLVNVLVQIRFKKD